MKIHLFGQHFSEYVLTLASNLDDAIDYRVILDSGNFHAEIAEGDTPLAGAKPLELLFMPGPQRLPQFLKSLYRMQRLWRRDPPDLVHFQEMPKGFGFLCWLLCRASKRRVRRVLTIHDVTSHPGQDSNTSGRQEAIRNSMRRSADALIVHGDHLLRQLQQLDPTLAAKTTVIAHPAMRAGLGAVMIERPAAGRILFFGRIARYKGLRCLLEACVLLQRRQVPFTLVIAGQGDDFEANRNLLAQIDSVDITNRRIAPDEIDAFFTGSDIVALPYIEASQSGVAAYALGFGRACVATRTGSLPEIVRHGYNGLLCQPDDPTGLADCLASLLNDPALLDTLGHNARLLGQGPFSAATAARATVNVYLSVLGLARAAVPAEMQPVRMD